MRLLVMGGAGFIGSNFVRFWHERRPEDETIVVDALKLPTGESNLKGLIEKGDRSRVRLCIGDMCQGDLVERTFAEFTPDVVVNFAAESHNSRSVLSPADTVRNNVLSVLVLLEILRRYPCVRLHHISTCEVYGDMALDSSEPFTEESPYRPNSPYSASKAAVDHLVRAYASTFDLLVTISNCCNNYGPRQFPEKLIPLFLTRAEGNLPLPIYQSSNYRREWLHVKDHCLAIEAILERGKVGETYNVGSGVERSVEEIADQILALTGRGPDLKQYVPDRPSHDRRYLLDSIKIRDELGWEPTISFEDGLRDTVAWYRDNSWWWRNIDFEGSIDESRWKPARTG